MPNHVHGIVVMVGFGIIVLVGGFQTRPYGTGTRGFCHRGIGGDFVIVAFCRGGFQTRPHGESVRRERETVATKEHLCRRREGGF